MTTKTPPERTAKDQARHERDSEPGDFQARRTSRCVAIPSETRPGSNREARATRFRGGSVGRVGPRPQNSRYGGGSVGWIEYW